MSVSRFRPLRDRSNTHEEESSPAPITDLEKLEALRPDNTNQSSGYYGYFKKLFQGSYGNSKARTNLNIAEADNLQESSTPCEEVNSDDFKREKDKDCSSLLLTGMACRERTFPNVLNRIKFIIDSKGEIPRQYKDGDFKQFWLPDSESSTCYDCLESFNPFRRRHHCRICGQIFCSGCCNKMVPGKILGYKGELRVCIFCCKVVISYLKSTNVEEDILSDLKAIEVQLLPNQSAVSCGDDAGSGSDHSVRPSSYAKSRLSSSRKIIYGFKEENYAVRSRVLNEKESESISSERELLLKDSHQLHSLWCQMVSGPSPLPLSTNRWKLKVFPNSFIGRDFVLWLIDIDKASSTHSAVAIGQALLEAGFIMCISQTNQFFVNDYAIYNILKPKAVESKSQIHSVGSSTHHESGQEPLWLKQISSKSEDNYGRKKRISETVNSTTDYTVSGSSYSLNMNIEDNTVSVKNSKKQREGNVEIEDSLQSSVTSILNSSVSAYQSEQLSNSALMMDEILEAIRTLEARELEIAEGGDESEQNGEKQETKSSEQITQEAFNLLWASHESALLNLLLTSYGLPSLWGNIMMPVVYKVVDTIRPDVKNEYDDMDIRQYIQFKKIPGVKRFECQVINGTVCTKNVVHRDMKSRFVDPQILLISTDVDPTVKLDSQVLSLNNVIVQEADYLKKVIPRIISYHPDIILCGKRIAYNARELLRAEGISLIMNLKQSVMERIARCTQAQIINSVETELNSVPGNVNSVSRASQPLGMCHSFYLCHYSVPKGTAPKTLMFFDGCATHLGCTIILKGPTEKELKKVKRIMYFMIFALYNWKLERSFLMDEFATLPSLRNDFSVEEKINLSEIKEADKSDFERKTGISVTDDENSKKLEKNSVVCETDGKLEKPPMSVGGDSVEQHSLATEQQALSTEQQSFANDKFHEKTLSVVKDACLSGLLSVPEDNIQSSLFPTTDVKSSNCEVLDCSKALGRVETSFSLALKDAVLSISPYIPYGLPFLESEVGRRCPLRKYFPGKLYNFSVSHGPKSEYKGAKRAVWHTKECRNIIYKPTHYFVASKITKSAKHPEVRADLADFRARGCIIQTVCPCQQEATFTKEREGTWRHHQEVAEPKEKKEIYNSLVLGEDGEIQALHPFNHQRISVLFSSFCHSSNQNSTFCVEPWVVTMDFHGRNDISLGSYLERYCFNLTYKCPLDECHQPCLRHVRKFVHGNGCVEILMRVMDSPLDESSTIYMWNWCKICRQVSAVVPMSSNTWLFSFAKYLELRFQEAKMCRGGSPGCSPGSPGCPHSIQRDHFHYFGQKKLVAVIRYSAFDMKELVIPPTELAYSWSSFSLSFVADQLKSVALQGFGIFSTIKEKLKAMLEEQDQRWDSTVGVISTHHQQQKKVFREGIESIELQLTSPALEHLSRDTSAPTSCRELATITFGLIDQITILKRLIVKVIQDWNNKVQNLYHLKKKDERVDKVKTSVLPDQLSNLNSGRQLSFPALPTSDNPIMNSDGRDSPASLHSVSNMASIECNTSQNDSSAEEKRKRMGRSSSNPEPAQDSNSSSDRNAESGAEDYLGTDSNLSGETNSAQASLQLYSSPSKTCQSSEQSWASDELGDVSREPSDKKGSSVKNIITTFLSSSTDLMIKSPFEANEHYATLAEIKIPLVLYDEEPSSIVSVALASQEYETQLHILQKRSLEMQSSIVTCADSAWSVESSQELPKIDNLLQKEHHIELQWSDCHAKYYCKIVYAEHFRKFRQLVFPDGEELFIRSLSRCVLWEARGGKSGSLFCKTIDDRFILKEMGRLEISSFADFATDYIQYMTDRVKNNHPTTLARILGVYRIGFRNTTTNKAQKFDLLVLENLFYQRVIGPKYDLKGSVRNRKVDITGKEESEVVLLDENLLQMASSSQFLLRPHSKAVLTTAIASDSAFLSLHFIMDYSLLVGVDEKRNEIVVGIIDYIRTFTWDKKLETILKGSVLGAGTGKQPTIISPELYRKRFCLAMEKYFALVPDRWSGLGLSFDS